MFLLKKIENKEYNHFKTFKKHYNQAIFLKKYI